MSYGTKAQAPYISILLGVAFLMTLLFIPLFSTLYDNDPLACEAVEYTIQNECKENNRVGFMLKNNGEVRMNFIINGDPSNVETVEAGDTVPVQVITTDLQVELTPVVIDGTEFAACNSKKYSQDGGLIISTCQ